MLIVITPPHGFAGESERITLMFQSGLQRLHVRKPDSTLDECRRLLQSIPTAYHRRIVLHDHFDLVHEFALGGVHVNRRNPVPPATSVPVSTSCHSLDELREKRKGPYAYLSLSPIFDSVSKPGYRAAFPKEELLAAKEQGLIDGKVLALGGVTRENADEALALGFGGVMMLGDAWKEQPLPVVLSIAGSDPSAGAGIQQDLKTMTLCGAYGATVITALTSQNTTGVQGVMPVPAETVESQLRSVFADLRVNAVKIGMIPNKEVAQAVVRVLKEEKRKRILPVVCDPILLSTSGTRLMAEDCVAYVAEELFPLCTLVTPNLPEHEYLVSRGFPIPTNCLLKGGHAEGEEMTDVLILPDENRSVSYRQERIDSPNLHGTGCALSSAIASYMAQGLSLEPAVGRAKQWVTQAILGGKELHIGHGNGPLWYNPNN